MTGSERLRRRVEFALPKPCEVDEENFAGDPLVRAFCDPLRRRHHLDFHVYVAWACPPDVKVLQPLVGGGPSAVIRSERIDTLLVEYFCLRELGGSLVGPPLRDVSVTSVLKWMSEFLIGYRQPELAVLALTFRPHSPLGRLTSPFRDEALASVPGIARTAIQCFSLAHEVGHLLAPKRQGATLDAEMDGMSLRQHALTQEQQEGSLSEELLAGLAEVRERELDAGNLLAEVEADLFAFGTVVDFLCRGYDCPVEAAVEAAMIAYECQAFVYACKGTCLSLASRVTGGLDVAGFRRKDYLLGVEIAVRARAVVRRAGLVWAVNEQPIPPAGGRDYNAFVGRVDAILRPSVGFRSLMAEVLSEQVDRMLAAIEGNAGSEREAWLNAQFLRLEEDSAIRLDLFYILLSFGCSGAVDPAYYLRGLRPANPRGM